MFILPGLLGLVVFLFTRPLDFMDSLRGIPFLYLFVGFALLGYVADVGAGKNKYAPSPHLRLVLGLLGWCLLSVMLKAPWAFVPGFIELAIVLILFFLMSHGVRNLRAFERLAGVLLLCTLWISLVCAHQGLQPPTCVLLPPGANHTASGVPTGMYCEDIISCYDQEPQPEGDLHCEHVGWFGLSSVTHRVRYACVLHDPNEVSLAVAVGVPIAIGRVQRRRRKRFLDLLILLVTLLLTGLTVVLSKSRGGQLVFLAVLGIYFLRRFKVAGLIISGVAALPLLMLGGRGGAEASASSMERLECWEAGITMMKANPFMGVGFRQFLQHHHLTAHNSFMLAAGELGMIGMTMFTGLLALCVKIALEATKILKPSETPEDDPAEGKELDEDTRHALAAWGEALLASMTGMAVGVFFLSFVYHYVLWIYVGFIGAYYAVVHSYKPNFRVALASREWRLVFAGNVMLVIALSSYIRLKLG